MKRRSPEDWSTLAPPILQALRGYLLGDLGERTARRAAPHPHRPPFVVACPWLLRDLRGCLFRGSRSDIEYEYDDEDDDDSEEKPLVAAGRLRWVLCGCPFHLYDLRVQPIRVNSRLFAVRILQPT